MWLLLLGTTASANVLFTLPDITPPSAVGDALPNDVGGGASIYGQNDTLRLVVSEPIDSSRITMASITIGGSSSPSLGTGYSVAVQEQQDSDGYGASILITLGSSPNVSAGNTISITAADVVDSAGNKPTTALTYNVLAASLTSITGISIDSGHYSSGDEIYVDVTFSKDVTVSDGDSVVSIDLEIGGSSVLAGYVSGSGTDTLRFRYIASGIIGNGVTVVGDSIVRGTRTIRDSGGTNVLLTFAEQVFSGAIVDAAFSISVGAGLWLDATDVDGDGDWTDHSTDLDLPVDTWIDKSGLDHDVTQSTDLKKPALTRDNRANNLPSVRYDGRNDFLFRNETLVDLDNSSGLSLFVVFTAGDRPSNPTNKSNLLLSFRGTNDSTKYTNRGLFLVAGDGLLTDTTDYIRTSIGRSISGDSKWSNARTANGSIIYNQTLVYGETFVRGQKRSLYTDGIELPVEQPTWQIDGIGHLSIGGEGVNARSLWGSMHEVVVYEKGLTESEFVIVENYLASKWGSEKLLTAVDYYSGDMPAVGDYDFDVTGILRYQDAVSDTRVISSSSGGITISSVSFIQDAGDAMFIGSDRSDASTDGVTDGAGARLSGLVSTVRSGSWYLDITDAGTGGGSINVAIDPHKLGIDVTNDASVYELLWRSGQSGDFSRVSIADTVIDGIVSFNDIVINASATDAVVQGTTKLIKDGYIALGMNDQYSPQFESAEIDSNVGGSLDIVITMDEDIDPMSIQASGEFTVTPVGGSVVVPTVTQVVGAENRIRLTVSGSLTTAYAVSYVATTLKDYSGNLPLAFNVLVGTDQTTGDTLAVPTSGEWIVVGGQGDDRLTASAGVDVFDYNFLSDGKDTIVNFGDDGADRIDLSDLLQGYIPSSSSLTDYIDVTSDGGSGIVIYVDAHGQGQTTPGSGLMSADVTISVTGAGVTSATTTQDLLNANKLILSR